MAELTGTQWIQINSQHLASLIADVVSNTCNEQNTVKNWQIRQYLRHQILSRGADVFVPDFIDVITSGETPVTIDSTDIDVAIAISNAFDIVALNKWNEIFG